MINSILVIVQNFGEWIDVAIGPDRIEVFVWAPAEQQVRGGGHARARDLAHDRIGVRQRPAAVLEAATRVLVRPARRLHDSVEGETLESSDLSHLSAPTRDGRLTSRAATNPATASKHMATPYSSAAWCRPTRV